MRSSLLAFSLLIAAIALPSCTRDKTHSGGCLSNAPDCTLPTPCEALSFVCTGSALDIRTLDGTARPAGGWAALAAKDDVYMSNGEVKVVIAAIGHQYHLAPNGGSILDFATGDNDAINEIYQAAGLLPEDAVRYTSLKVIDERPTRVAVQVNGALDGRPGVRVHTLYELRPCDPGVRVRTELVNETPDTHMLFVGDAYFWGNHTAPAPFSPVKGEGFIHPPVRLTALDAVYTKFPFMAANLHGPTPDGSPNAVYTAVACNEPALEGFHSIAVSAAGSRRSILAPRDATVFERFIGAVNGEDARAGIDLALDVRNKLFEEGFVTLRGTVQVPSGALGNERVASVLVSEGSAATAREDRTPWTQVVPAADGTWSARVPVGKSYLVEVASFGRTKVERDVPNVRADTDTGTYVIPASTEITVDVVDSVTRAPLFAELVVIPTDQATADATEGDLHGAYERCTPWLGTPGAASPACNRALVSPDMPLTFNVPNGRYDIYALKSPMWSIDMVRVTLDGTPLALTLEVTELPVMPAGTLGADMHIHGAASHDSYIPDDERAKSFASADIDVAIATDHDVVYDYGPELARLGLGDRISSVVGLESTNWIPWFRLPGYPYPLTLGHFNWWPLRYDPTLPRNGGPFDEYKEPGELYDEIESRGLFTTPAHMVQLNHPLSSAELGRDLGFVKALFFDAQRDLPAADDGSGNWIFVHKPNGGHANSDFQAQEVMNGTASGNLLPYRAFWFYLLNQGMLRTGTANSDSHGLLDSTIGIPRTLVSTPTLPGPGFDIEQFDTALRAGRAEGTNGPVIEATIDTPAGAQPFGLTPLRPQAGGSVHVRVSAAPWVNVEQVRFVVNGRVAKTIEGTDVTNPADPLGTVGELRWVGDVLISELLAGVTGDAWIVVEAGRKLALVGDLGGGLNGVKDGLPDTTDNNRDGVVDASDVPTGSKVGPLKNPSVPTDEADPEFHFARLTHGGYPFAFTNPFVLDVNGNGRFDAPGLNGGRAP